MRLFTKKTLSILGVGGILLATAGGAFAFWTQQGGGTATGTAGTTGTIVLSGTIDPGIFPGGSRAVNLSATNSGTSSVTVGTVSLVSVATTAGCLPADFTMAPVVENFAVPAASTTALPNAGTLVMANTAVNQDACKGATITLTLAST